MCKVIEIQDLSFSYGNKQALSNVSLCIEDSGIYAVIGPNGSGKTTLLRILVGLIRPSSGCVKVFGKDPSDPSLSNIVSYQGTSLGLYPHLSVQDNLEIFCILKFGDLNVCKDLIDKSLEVLNLLTVRKELVRKLSTGYRKRVAIARALLGVPRLLILDEPFVHLDVDTKNRLRNYLSYLYNNYNETIIFTTCSIDDVIDFATHVIVLLQGKIVLFKHIDSYESIEKSLIQLLSNMVQSNGYKEINQL